VLADVGLVGFPSSGKSTLLSVVSAAKPKIAEYHFTTLVPNLGIVGHREKHSFVMADIPGIIEGAHLGKGLGHQFLRHIERTKILALLLDSSSENIEQDYKILSAELESYSPEMAKKRRIVVYTKKDLPRQSELPTSKVIGKHDAVEISAVTGENLDILLTKIWKLLQNI